MCQVESLRLRGYLCEDVGRREIIERSLPRKESWWGSDMIQIYDLDGNELLFHYRMSRSRYGTNCRQ